MIMTLRILQTLFLLLIVQHAACWSAALPRGVIALYDSKADKDSWFSNVLQYAATPIEQQGLVITYHDVQQGFPDLVDDQNILGAVIWDVYTLDAKQEQEYLDWAIRSLEGKKKLVFLGNLPGEQLKPGVAQQEKVNHFWQLMGLSVNNTYEGDSFGTQYIEGPPFVLNFERSMTGKMPKYLPVSADNPNTTVYLTAKSALGKKSALVASTPSGGYVASGYALYKGYFNDRDYIQWYINPFIFFKDAYQTQHYPKPDTTTLSGRRMYYSHIDGDGWNSVSLIGDYRENRDISAKVIFDEVIAPNAHLPVTVAPVVADLDPDWVGLPQSQKVAKELFALDQVEIGSHTYSHPFDWGFFKDYDPRDEEQYLDKYPFKTWVDNSVFDEMTELLDKEDGERKDHLEKEFHYPKKVGLGYTIPRAFANKKFNINLEVAGSAKFINRLADQKKTVQVIQWSGNCLPFEKALEIAYGSGLKNINGGDTRFDAEYDSYGWVRPLGRNVGPWRQVFSSMSNENLYTDLWSKRFYGFNRLPHTFYHTETPIRVRPMNLYYHMYSGEKFASLQALLQNIEYIDNQEIIPVETSYFTDVVDGYYNTEITPMGENQWSISNRGALQTIRFDEATFKVVDIEQSKGVIGQRHLQGSLYVALDENVKDPLIALREQEQYYQLPDAIDPYLIESRWHIWGLGYLGKETWRFQAQGYGDGEMSWYVPKDGEYVVNVGNKEVMTIGASDHVLELVLTQLSADPLVITIKRKGD
jgi:polysaccharide biosynthesis protein PelA